MINKSSMYLKSYLYYLRYVINAKYVHQSIHENHMSWSRSPMPPPNPKRTLRKNNTDKALASPRPFLKLTFDVLHRWQSRTPFLPPYHRAKHPAGATRRDRTCRSIL